MYCDFQPAFLFLLTQGTKRKHSSALANYKPKIHSIIIKNRELGFFHAQFSIFILLMLLAKKVVDGLYGVEC